LNKNVKFDDSKLLNDEADNLYWSIIGNNQAVEKFRKDKAKENALLYQTLLRIQEECGKSKEGHDFRLFEKAILEIDRDKLKCQKCGKTT
jgi:hypothetical protein